MDPSERNYVEITQEDIQRMRGLPSSNRSAKLLEEKLKLKALSEERAERWPNTIKALREKRLLAKEEELHKLEQERLKLDASEAIYKDEQRKLQERCAQIQYKEKLKQDWKRQDEKWMDLERTQVLEQSKEEKLKLEKENLAKIVIRDEQLSQIEEHKLKLAQSKKEKELEKEMLQKQKEELHLESERNEEKRKKKIMEVKTMFCEAKKEHREKREEETEKMKEMEKRNAEYITNKEKKLECRKASANAKTALKEEQKELTIKRLSEGMSNSREDEKKILMDQQHTEMEEDRKEIIRAEKERKDWKACDQSRRKQIHQRKMQLEAVREQDRYDTEKSWQRCWEIREENATENIEKFRKNRSIALHHLKSREEKAQRDAQERKETLQEEKDMIERLNYDDLKYFPIENLLT